MKLTTIVFLFLLILAGCSKNSPTLPDERPADFVLNYQIDGGMSNYHVEMKLFRDSIELYVRKEGEKTNKKENLPVGKLDSLYSFLKKADLDKIHYRSVKETVYDRGGRSLRLTWKGKEIYISDAQKNLITEDSYEKWTNVVDEIEKFAGLAQ